MPSKIPGIPERVCSSSRTVGDRADQGYRSPPILHRTQIQGENEKNAMQESYNLLQLQTKVLDLVSDAVIAINNQQRVIYLNQAATAQYGVEREEVIGQPLESLWQYRSSF
jgi:PAS domain-containing protein